MKNWINILSGFFGVGGIILSLYSFDKTITAGVVGVNGVSQTVGVVGIILMITSIIIQKYQLNHK